jgi:PAS domain S-box-containing protein
MVKEDTTNRVRRSVARRLILVTVMFSVTVTLFATAGQLYLDYKNDVGAINARVEQIRSGHLAGLVASIWSFDENLTRIQLEGLLRMPDIEFLAINQNGKEKWMVGELISKKIISVELPLEYLSQGTKVPVGNLQIVASLDAVYGRLIEKGFTILLTVGILIFLVTGFLFYVVQRLITRHLTSLATYTRTVKYDEVVQPFRFDRDRSNADPSDEFDVIAHEMNETWASLKSAYDDQKDHKEQLEQKVLDLTRAETALHRSEERFRDFAHASSDWFWETDLEGKINWESEIAEGAGWHGLDMVVGKSREEIAGDLLSQTDWQPYQQALAAHLEFKNFEYCYPGSDGNTRFARISGNPRLGTNGEYLGHRGVASNITEIKLAETALRQSEEIFRSLVEGSLQGMLVLVDATVVYANSAAARIFGYGDEEIIGVHGDDLTSATDLNRLRDFRHSKGEGNLIVVARRKDGSHFDCETMSTNINWQGKPARLSTMLDVSERKRAEESLRQAQKMEAVGQLTGGVAHDFNNLLAVMIGHAEMLGQAYGDDDEAALSVGAIIQAVDRASSLTSRLLAFSRQQQLSPVATDVTDLIRSLDDMLRRTLGETIDLKIVNGADLWLATIDPHQFESAVLNLGINARDAMPKGGTLVIETANVTLDQTYVEQYDELTPGDYLKVSVSDTGFGISAEDLAKVFEPFFTTKDVGKGSGLGLSMVYGFAKQSTGHVTIYSEVDHGTTVKLYIPRAHGSLDADDQKEEEPKHERGSERILIVEDEANVRFISVKLLRNQGYDIVEAADSQEAIKHLEDGGLFDLIFTDVVLPGGLNGVEIAEEAKRIQPNIKVLFTTGYAENAVVHHGQLDPATTLVNKPYRKTELLEKVRAILDGEDA